MWQFLLTAAVAGSGLFAKRFLNTNADPSTESETKCDHSKEKQPCFATSTVESCDGDGSVFRFSSSGNRVGSPSRNALRKSRNSGSVEGLKNIVGDYSKDEQQHLVISTVESCECNGDDGSFFRFSSSGSRVGSGHRLFQSKRVIKKSGNRGNAEGLKKLGFGKVEKKCGCLDGGKSVRNFGICVKKRRTSRNVPGRCESCCSKVQWSSSLASYLSLFSLSSSPCLVSQKGDWRLQIWIWRFTKSIIEARRLIHTVLHHIDPHISFRFIKMAPLHIANSKV